MPCDGDLLITSPASLCGIEPHSSTGLPSGRECFQDVILAQAHTSHVSPRDLPTNAAVS